MVGIDSGRDQTEPEGMRINDQEANRLRVLKAIRRAEPVARTDLVKLTGLASGTITEITGELLQRNLLLEVKSSGGGPGRPRMQLLLNPDAAYVAGAFITYDGSLTVEVSNARGERLFGRTCPIAEAPDLASLVDQYSTLIDEVLRDSPIPRSKITSVGLALPGTVDSIRGDLLFLPTFSAEPFAVAELIGRRLQLPVIVDNHVDTMARAEHWFGEDRQVDDFSLFVAGATIGFSRYLDGALHVGAHGVNSEVAHVKFGPLDGPLCFCGEAGCLDTLASGYGAVLRVCESRGLASPSIGEVRGLHSMFAREARAGDRVAKEAFDRAGRYLGIAVANHINMSDPPRVLVVALDADFGDLVAASFHASLQRNTFAPLRGRVPVQFKVSEGARYAHGTAALVLERLYRQPT